MQKTEKGIRPMKHNNIFSDFVKRTAVMLSVMLLTAATAWAGSKPVMNVESIKGYAWGMELSGWAYDPDAPGEAVDIVINYYTDAEFKHGTASTYGPTYLERADVNSKYGITGLHGFKDTNYLGGLALPTDGTFYVQIIAKDVNGGDEDVVYQSSAIVVGLEAAPKFNGNRLELTSETEALKVGDGCVITGTGGECTCIVIEDGATVTLDGIDITTDKYDWGKEPVGIKCLGNATIILKKGTTNYIRGGRDIDPNIQVGPKNTTLTLKGYGTLVARSFGHGSCIGPYEGEECGNIVIESGFYDLQTSYKSRGQGYSGHAACIGGSGFGGSCGNITITGGNITAWSSFAAAAIGTGRVGSCGNITITGGNIYARSESPQGGAAIGGGLEGNCGNISISGITSVSAVKYSDDTPYCIGPGGANSTCGTLTLWGQVTNYPVGRSHYYGPTVFGATDIPFTVSFDANGGTGKMEDQNFYSNTPQELRANTFTLNGKYLSHWSTMADGDGYDYADKENVTNLGNVTLYAQWHDSYTIHFDKNGGTGTMEDQQTMALDQVLNANTFTRTDYFFVGWNTEADGSGTSYADGGTVRVQDNLTLYAQWTPSVLTLTKNTGDVLLVNGHILTGTGGENTHVVISDGATVKLSDVDITAISKKNYWAGINCEGDATIILVDGTTNNVKGNSGQYPAIYVPEGKTLTIKGDGALKANNNGSGAGIGAGLNKNCGNIIIEGGIITASGGNEAAGIGGATAGACGNITITSGVTSVTASGGWNAPNSIGAGNRTCGTVTIGGRETGNIAMSIYTYEPDETVLYTITFIANGGEGTMEAQTLASNIPQALTANAFTRTDYIFMGWTTAADGSGPGYSDGQIVMNTGSVSLYAQWSPSNDITLINSTGYLALNDGQSLSGTGGANTHIVIADGATVTLKGVNITDIANNDSHKWAGISCLGDATIILADGTINSVKGGHEYYPGIHVPVGKTLTIKGTGTLNAGSNGHSAGIGGGLEIDCGNIVIEGGIINATAGGSAAGIGSGNRGTCGNITITGGTITATGSVWGAGIGGVQKCGNITITEGITSVTAIKGSYTSIYIGADKECGTITIAPELTDVIDGNTCKLYHTLTLTDNADNTTTISDKNNQITPVALSGRTLYKDGNWNTLCLPFDVDNLNDTPLEGAIIKELDGTTSNLTDGTLTLNFTDATSIEAGKPYIVKWALPELALTITKDADWETFASNVSDGTEDYAGKLVKLATNINVSEMVGTSGHPFCGTFDGDGHTINANLTGDGSGTALFFQINNATILNLNVTGTVNGYERPATIAAIAGGVSTIKNCCSSVSISSTKTNDWVDGGAFVARINGDATLNLQNCLFTGSVSYDDTAYSGGSMVGFTQNGATGNVTNCLYSPTSLALTESDSEPHIFVSGDARGNITNSYYNAVAKASILEDEGTDASSMTASELAAALGDGWEVVGDNVVPKKLSEIYPPIVNPVFKNVTINADAETSVAFSGGQFVGTYSPVALTPNDWSNLFLGADNTLFYPSGANNSDGKYHINSCRAYFHIDGSTPVKEFKMKFNEDDATSLSEELRVKSEESDNAIYNLSGQKLSKPQKGINIVNGKKVLY